MLNNQSIIGHKGRLSWRLYKGATVLFSVTLSAFTILARVSLGIIIASTYPLSAAFKGFANFYS